MRTTMKTWIGATAVAVLVGCQRAPAPAAKVEAPLTAKPVIVKLVGRHETITVHPGGVLSVHDAEGKLVAHEVTREQLRGEYPDIYRRMDPALAEGPIMLHTER